MSKQCAECGCTHGPGNTNSMCPLASNYRPSADQLSDQVAKLQARVAELEAKNEALGRAKDGFASRMYHAETRVAELEAVLSASDRAAASACERERALRTRMAQALAELARHSAEGSDPGQCIAAATAILKGETRCI